MEVEMLVSTCKSTWFYYPEDQHFDKDKISQQFRIFPNEELHDYIHATLYCNYNGLDMQGETRNKYKILVGKPLGKLRRIILRWI
jgi:hypothetical protein